ncbi:MAG: hypothetical protein WC565_03105 [Parcubacteria group bacterium]
MSALDIQAVKERLGSLQAYSRSYHGIIADLEVLLAHFGTLEKDAEQAERNLKLAVGALERIAQKDWTGYIPGHSCADWPDDLLPEAWCDPCIARQALQQIEKGVGDG